MLGAFITASALNHAANRTAPLEADCLETLQTQYPTYAWESVMVAEVAPDVCVATYRPALTPTRSPAAPVQVQTLVSVELPIRTAMAPTPPLASGFTLGGLLLLMLTALCAWKLHTLGTQKRLGGSLASSVADKRKVQP